VVPLLYKGGQICYFFYPKKLGLIKRKITPDAPRRAIPITTFMIISIHHFLLPVEIMIPQTIIKTKDKIKITVTNILVRLHINTGKAVSPVTAFSSPGQTLFGLSSIQLPIKGTDVLSDIQQHTLGSLQGLHIPSTSLVPEGHEHN